MGTILVQLHDDENNIDICPVTPAKAIKNKKGESLEEVEAKAQENKIECVEFDGEELVPIQKKIYIPGYTFVKEAVPEQGMHATYRLYKGNNPVGVPLNIEKDVFVKNGSCKVCQEKDVPEEGYNIGDWYLDILLTNNQHVYIKINVMAKQYTAGAGIIINNNNEISIDDTVVVTHDQLNLINFITYRNID